MVGWWRWLKYWAQTNRQWDEANRILSSGGIAEYGLQQIKAVDQYYPDEIDFIAALASEMLTGEDLKFLAPKKERADQISRTKTLKTLESTKNAFWSRNWRIIPNAAIILLCGERWGSYGSYYYFGWQSSVVLSSGWAAVGLWHVVFVIEVFFSRIVFFYGRLPDYWLLSSL